MEYLLIVIKYLSFGLISIVEIILFCLGITVLLYNSERRVSECLSRGILLGIILLSLIYQTCFLLNLPELSFFFELLCLYIFGKILFTNRPKLKDIYRITINWLSKNKYISIPIILIWTYLLFQVILLPPANWDSMTYNLARVFMFNQSNTFFLKNINFYPQAIFPVATDILPYSVLRFYSDYGVAIYSFLAYISIVLGTYALCRKYHSVEISTISSLLILSLPELIYQSTSTKPDIINAASGVFVLLTLQNIYEQINLKEIIIFLLGLSFGLGSKTTFAFFIIALIPASIILFKKEHFWQLMAVIKSNYKYLILASIPCFILSNIWLFIYNHNTWGTWAGPENFVALHEQKDSFLGFVANIVRYLFHFIDIPEPINLVFINITSSLFGEENGRSLTYYLQQIYDWLFKPIFNSLGMRNSQGSYVMVWTRSRDEDFSWFGILGFLLIIPSIIYSVINGKKFTRLASVVLVLIFLGISYKIAYFSANNRYFSLLFACSGLCVAYFISSLNLSKFIKNIITIIAIVTLIYSAFGNYLKPLITSPYTPLSLSNFNPINILKNLTTENIWAKSNWGQNRLIYSYYYNQDKRVDFLFQVIPFGSRLAVITPDDTWIYHYILAMPDVSFTFFNLANIQQELFGEIDNFDYILCLNAQCDLSQISSQIQVIAKTPENAQRPFELSKVNH